MICYQRNNTNVVLTYLEFLNRKEVYKIFDGSNRTLRNVWTNLGVWYRYVDSRFSDSCERHHIKLVKKLNADL